MSPSFMFKEFLLKLFGRCPNSEMVEKNSTSCLHMKSFVRKLHLALYHEKKGCQEEKLFVAEIAYDLPTLCLLPLGFPYQTYFSL